MNDFDYIQKEAEMLYQYLIEDGEHLKNKSKFIIKFLKVLKVVFPVNVEDLIN